jgi:heme-degrading monooxygenase HmoA
MTVSQKSINRRPSTDVAWQWEAEATALKLSDQPGFVSVEVVTSPDGLTEEATMVWESQEAMEAAFAAVAESKRAARIAYMEAHGITASDA